MRAAIGEEYKDEGQKSKRWVPDQPAAVERILDAEASQLLWMLTPKSNQLRFYSFLAEKEQLELGGRDADGPNVDEGRLADARFFKGADKRRCCQILF